jgi:hypothetical protein
MRTCFLLVFALVGGMAAGLNLAAQTTATVAVQGPGAAKNPMIGFLSQQDQDRVIGAHDRALALDPRLKLEEEALKQAGPDMRDASAEDQMAFLEKVRIHQQKVRQGMLKQDPTIGPLLDEIDRHLSQMRAAQEKAAPMPSPGPAAAAPTNASPAPAAH